MSMAGIAEREKRRPWLWGLLTALISFIVQTTLIGGYFGAVLSFFIAFGLMTYANIRKPVKKGVMKDIE
jgi:asparagine N-glycosylation enzyme membrane subunit Stt3